MGQRAACEDTDLVSSDRADWDATVLERLVSAFEEQAMARVNGFGLAGGNIEERGVESCDAFLKEVCSFDVELSHVWISLHWLWER